LAQHWRLSCYFSQPLSSALRATGKHYAPRLPACAAETRREDGCLEYRFYENTEHPGKFVFVERWRDQQALDGHFSSSHLAAFQQASAPLLTGRRGVLYEVDEGKEL
jgi:quinol monooxygenase YgiN